jgi:zinc/manganese transport system permease protein
VSGLLAAVTQTGFFADEAVRVALAVGTVVAIVAGAVGVFTVMRGQSFAGEALGDLGATGGSGAFLVGVGPLWGFLAMGIAAAGVMELIGIQRPRGRDLATGIVLGAGLGLAALFLYWDANLHNTTGATITILFGSVFAISSSTFPLVTVLGVAALGIVLALYRPLLLSTISAEMAAARGVPVRLVGAAYLLALAVTVALAAVTIGAILSTALLIGPAASALRLTKRPGRAMLVAGAIGIVAVWLGILLAYESYYWPPAGRGGWPVSFFVVTLIFLLYLISGLPARVRARKQGSHRGNASRVDVSRRTGEPRIESAGS